ncbi:uncharacterized protein PAC_12013 [Phialocephala subalpina]|uniref:Heterokaryon incompatibility domain-containing protein n=1 Tax=Phialocephala subalpina TaxID=576137 RepID=A0A1L7XAU9_9HELO|nr:uncharacterized protein PAC_12013 [Phialocephala subalpina]
MTDIHDPIHKPLDTSKAQIRLLHLQPPLDSEPDAIVCTLSVADPDDDDCKYEALSYEWGDSRSTSLSIMLDGTHFLVRENLWWALWHLRLETEDRILWIDALCINQENGNERNHQVKQMAQVYSKAASVVAWIGRLEQQVYHDGTCDYVKIPESYLESLSEHWSWEKSHKSHIKTITPRESRDPGRPFWKFPDTVLFRILKQRETRAYDSHPEPNMFDAVYAYWDAACENMLDHVYGLLGFVKSCCRDAVPVRYDINPTDLCVNLLQHFFSFHYIAADGFSYSLPREIEVVFKMLYKSARNQNPSACLGNLLGSHVIFGDRQPVLAGVKCEIMGLVLDTPGWMSDGVEIALEHEHKRRNLGSREGVEPLPTFARCIERLIHRQIPNDRSLSVSVHAPMEGTGSPKWLVDHIQKLLDFEKGDKDWLDCSRLPATTESHFLGTRFHSYGIKTKALYGHVEIGDLVCRLNDALLLFVNWAGNDLRIRAIGTSAYSKCQTAHFDDESVQVHYYQLGELYGLVDEWSGGEPLQVEFNDLYL